MPKSKKAKTKYYAVAHGKTPGIYQTWDDAMDQIRGFSKPRHRSFKTKEAAEQYLLENGVGVSAVATRASRRIAGLPAHGFTAKKKAKGPTEPQVPPAEPEPSDATFPSPASSTSATPELSARNTDESHDRSSRTSTPHSGSPDIVDALESLLRLQELTADALRAFGSSNGKAPLSAGILGKDEAMGILRRVNDGLQREQRVLQAVCSESAPATRPPENDLPAVPAAPSDEPSAPVDEPSADVSFLSLYES